MTLKQYQNTEFTGKQLVLTCFTCAVKIIDIMQKEVVFDASCKAVHKSFTEKLLSLVKKPRLNRVEDQDEFDQALDQVFLMKSTIQHIVEKYNPKFDNQKSQIVGSQRYIDSLRDKEGVIRLKVGNVNNVKPLWQRNRDSDFAKSQIKVILNQAKIKTKPELPNFIEPESLQE